MVLGFVALVTPLTPGSWLIPIGLELIGIRLFLPELTGLAYRTLVKPILFLFPADQVHALFLRWGRRFGRFGFIKYIVKRMWRYDEPILEQTLAGLHFTNPVGLAAGFDYDADLVELLPSIGFGFHTVGTLTHERYDGNPPPMLGRLPKSKSLLVNKGFKNESVGKVLSGMSADVREAPRGVSIGATNRAYRDYYDMISDIIAGFGDAERFAHFDYYELNISCPNLLNIQNIQPQLASAEGLRRMLDRFDQLAPKRPVFIKMPLERTESEMQSLIDAIVPHVVIKGLIFSNLAKDRANPVFDAEEIQHAGRGNFSGKPVERQSNAMIAFVRRKYGNRFVLVGTGGIFTAEDAYRKIRLGASLVQLITGMVYGGPQTIGQINRGLARLLKRDGYRSILEASAHAETMDQKSGYASYDSRAKKSP